MAKEGSALAAAAASWALVRFVVVPRVRNEVMSFGAEATATEMSAGSGRGTVTGPETAPPRSAPVSPPPSPPTRLAELDAARHSPAEHTFGSMAPEGPSHATTVVLEDVASKATSTHDAAAASAGGAPIVAAVAATQLERVRAVRVFRYLLVFVGVLKSFGHGANDTANGTAAFVAVYDAFVEGNSACETSETEWWIMSIAGALVALGVITMGAGVIQTVGQGLTTIDYQLGFSIEFSSAFTVVIATFLGLPVSSTHCQASRLATCRRTARGKATRVNECGPARGRAPHTYAAQRARRRQVGAVVFVGWVAPSAAEDGSGGVSWRLFGKIALSWVLTLPLAGGLAALLTLAFRAGLQSYDDPLN